MFEIKNKGMIVLCAAIFVSFPTVVCSFAYMYTQVADLAKTIQDPLAAKLRERLNSQFGVVKNSKGKLGVDCVFSTEAVSYTHLDVYKRQPRVRGSALYSASEMMQPFFDQIDIFVRIGL